MTHYTCPINKPTCTLIRVFLSNKVLQAFWPNRMEYFATDPLGYMPLLVGLANYEPVGMNSSFNFLEVSAGQCSTYVSDRWLHKYPTNGHVLSFVLIPTGGWLYWRLSNWVPQTFMYSLLMHPYMERTCTSCLNTILHACVFPIWKEKPKISRS